MKLSLLCLLCGFQLSASAASFFDYPTVNSFGSLDKTLISQSGQVKNLSLGVLLAGTQPLDSDLTAIAALSTTSYGRGLLTGADAAATRVALGLGTVTTVANQAARLTPPTGGWPVGSFIKETSTGLTYQVISAAGQNTIGAYSLAGIALIETDFSYLSGNDAYHLVSPLGPDFYVAGLWDDSYGVPAFEVYDDSAILKAGNFQIIPAGGFGNVNLSNVSSGNYNFNLSAAGTGRVTVSSVPVDLKATSLKNSDYAAVAGDLVLAAPTSAPVNVTLPTNPVVGTRIGVKWVGAAQPVIINRGGSNVIENGLTSMTLKQRYESVILQYNDASPGTWYVVSGFAQIRKGSTSAMTAGSVTVSDSLATTQTYYFLTPRTLGTVTVPQAAYVSSRTAGSTFTITSASTSDTSIWNWMAIEP